MTFGSKNELQFSIEPARERATLFVFNVDENLVLEQETLGRILHLGRELWPANQNTRPGATRRDAGLNGWGHTPLDAA